MSDGQWIERGTLDLWEERQREQAARIEELEAENKRLNEQMDVIEEMGTESLNSLPDCLMRLAPALVENEELQAKLDEAMDAMVNVKNDLVARAGMSGSHSVELGASAWIKLCFTIAKLKGTNHD